MMILCAKLRACFVDIIPLRTLLNLAKGSDYGAIIGIMAATVKVVDGLETHFGFGETENRGVMQG
jgi:hypothetical protein